MNFNFFVSHPRVNEILSGFRYAEDAAMHVSCLGDGATIKNRNGKILWTEGKEKQPAGESYDYVAEIVFERAGA